jgi:two-component sensor histidine kinase
MTFLKKQGFESLAGILIILFCSSSSSFSQTWRKNADSLLLVYSKTENPVQQVELLTKASFVFLFQKPDTALLLSNKAVGIAEAGNNDTSKVTAYTSLSAVYLIRDDSPLTLEYALKAMTIAEKVPMPPDLMASIYRKLGYVYRNQDNDSAAIDAFKKSIDWSVKSKNQHDISATSSNLGQIYSKTKQYDSALYYHNQALKIAKQGNFKDIVVRCYINILNVYDARKNFTKAFQAFYEMEPWLNDADITPIVKGLAYTRIADLDIRKGNGERKLAARYLDSMKQLLKTTDPGTENKIDYYLNRSLLEFSKQHFDSAAAALEAFHFFKNIHDDELVKGHAQDLAVKYETGKKEQQIASLAEESRLRKLLMIVFIAASVVFLAFLVWTWMQNRKIKKQEARLSYLMKELHHRVKNNLQIVSSLLSLQSNRIEDEAAQKALQEGQYRIEAMSLIHRKLYQTDDVSGVNIKAFMNELSESLMHAYGYNHDRFQLEVESTVQQLDADTAIPLGLILNEVITNAFKYAYKNASAPSLHIVLTKNEHDLQLKISDNGPGLGEEQWKKSFSFGKQLMQSLIKQLKGTMQMIGTNGTTFIFTIPQYPGKA